MKKTNKNSLAETNTSYAATTAAGKANGANAATRESVAVRLLQPPPEIAFRPLPTGFEYPSAVMMSHYKKPNDAQREDAVAVADELTSAPSYHDDFGEQSPDPVATSAALKVAAQWDQWYAQVDAQARYAFAMRANAWDAALQPMGRLQKRYQVASKDDAEVAGRFPKTGSFFGARAAVAVRAAATRKKSKKAAAKGVKAGAPAPAVTPQPETPAVAATGDGAKA